MQSLKKMSGPFWNDSDRVITALVTNEYVFNAEMIHIRLQFFEKSKVKLKKLLQVLYKKFNIF
jgi:hypothetical protein